MKLLTKDIIKALPPIYSTDYIPLEDKIVICKFFTPYSDWTWFVFEGEPVAEEDYGTKNDYRLFGMVHGFEKEQGYFLLSELENLRGPYGMRIERDRSVFKTPYSQLVNKC